MVPPRVVRSSTGAVLVLVVLVADVRACTGTTSRGACSSFVAGDEVGRVADGGRSEHAEEAETDDEEYAAGHHVSLGTPG